MQTVAEIDEMLNEWEHAHPRLTPKTRKVRKMVPAWYKKLCEMEDYVAPPPPGILVSCGCPVRYRIAFAFLDRRCFVCKQFRGRVD